MPACKLCGIEITFERTAHGKLNPINVTTGKTHFADCEPYLAERKTGLRQASFADLAEHKRPD